MTKSDVKIKFFCLSVILITATAMIGVILCELVFRQILPLPPFKTQIPLRPNLSMALETDLRGVSPWGMHSTNIWGFRGDEPPKEWSSYYTIVTVGGSTTHCFYLDDQKTWPRLLQKYLTSEKFPRVWVGNGGTDGQTTRAHVHFMREIITSIKPDTVIILVGINDLGLSLNRTQFEHGKENDKRGTRWREWVYQRSSLVRFLYAWKKVLFDKAHVVTNTHKTISLSRLSTDTVGPSDDNVVLIQLDEYCSNLREIIALARRVGIRVVFVTQPLLFENTPYWSQFQGGLYWIGHEEQSISAATVRSYLDKYNKALISLCNDEGAEYVDLASIMPSSDAYFYDACHFTEMGAEFVASTLAKYLKSR